MLPAGTIGAGSTLVIHPTFDIPDRPVAASLFPPQAICVDTSGQATPWAPVQVQLLEWPAGRRFVSGDQESRYGPARRGKRSVNASGSSLA